MQKRKNDVKERTTLLLALPDEHQLRFSKYDYTKELWGAILKTFGRNEATKKTKKNQLKQQYGNLRLRDQSHLNKLSIGCRLFGKSKVLTVQGVSTGSAQVSTNSTNVADASLSYDTVCAFIATQPNRSQIKYKDISQIDDDDIKEMDKKWNLALLSIKADRFWKKTSKKITIQGSDVVGFDKSKVECFNCHKMGHFAREFRSPRRQDKGKKLKDNKIEYLRNELDEVKKGKESIDFKIENFENDSKDLDRLLESQKLDKNKKGVGFNEYYAVPPPLAQVYSPPKKDLSWMGLPEFVDDTVTDYTRPTPSIDVSKSVSKELEKGWKSNNPSLFEQGGSSGNVVLNPMIKFVKESGYPNATKVNNTKNARKPTVKYAEMYRNTSQSPRVKENQRNWNNQKSQQLGKDFMMQNKACYNYGSFDHLEFNYKHDIWVDKGKTWSRVNHAQDNMKYTSTHKSMTSRAVLLKSDTKPIAINRPFSTARPTLNCAQPKMTSFVKTAHLNVKRPFERKSAAKNKV
uniref:Uncharacterized protein n=1 Tax=Tanacetum cinerariifolium TaxID=118510 RepID=A0A699IC33_TANCI|nr:hypothetical protein [Tanacetum cinerariifolium]